MKPYFTILNGLLIGVVIFFGVKTFYKAATVPLKQIQIQCVTQQTDVSHNKKIRRPLSHYKNITKRNLFNTKTQIEKKTEEPKPVTKEPPQPTQLDLKLWGTVTGPGDKDYAVIQDTKKREQNLYAIGDTIQNATIKGIFREKIVLNVEGKDEILNMEDFVTGRRDSTRRTTTRKSVTSGRTRERNVTLDRSQIESAVSNLNNLMRQAKIRPHFRNGKPDGLSLSRIRSNSFFRKLGLRSGDIITGVDGKKIKSVDDALKFYENLTSSDNVKLEIKRRGRSQIINYKIE